CCGISTGGRICALDRRVLAIESRRRAQWGAHGASSPAAPIHRAQGGMPARERGKSSFPPRVKAGGGLRPSARKSPVHKRVRPGAREPRPAREMRCPRLGGLTAAPCPRGGTMLAGGPTHATGTLGGHLPRLTTRLGFALRNFGHVFSLSIFCSIS